MAEMLNDTEIFCGVARLPREMAAMEPSTYLAIEVAVDMKTEVVTDVACTAFPILCERLVVDRLMGKPVSPAFEELREILESRYHGMGKRAIIAALGNAFTIYTTQMKERRSAEGEKGNPNIARRP